ncbi:hypothetical protein [Duganella sp. BuS-21]|uniref:hypothetical protein n=1 Tax=Duganella sp. BuS-21 TaxID=2943848 RepID=UPI0035A5D2C1
MRKTSLILIVVLVALASAISGILLSECGVIHLNSKKTFRLEEPLLIEGEKQNSYSLLPAGTVMYYDKSWDEGHSTYHVYFHFKGEFKSAPTGGDGISPIWLRTVESDELPKLMADYPVSRDELSTILKAKRATKQDLLQILREWKE